MKPAAPVTNARSLMVPGLALSYPRPNPCRESCLPEGRSIERVPAVHIELPGPASARRLCWDPGPLTSSHSVTTAAWAPLSAS